MQRRLASVLCLVAITGLASQTRALEADETSCRFAEALGENDTAEIPVLVEDVSETWSDTVRDEAIQNLSRLSDIIEFAGGNVYRLTELGQDVVEDLVILRLAEGEVHALLLRYLGSPDGLRLDGLDYKQDIRDVTPLGLSLPAVPIAC